MTTQEKLIKRQLSLLELAEYLKGSSKNWSKTGTQHDG